MNKTCPQQTYKVRLQPDVFFSLEPPHEKKLRIVQWSAGNVGRRSIIAMHNNPLLELVGCHVRGADKAGKDAGVPAGIRNCADLPLLSGEGFVLTG